MPTRPLDRLLFAQGGLCFFCRQPIPKADASVEHLVASANGGSNGDDNCVVCCKTMNALLGSMSIKEKIQVVLNQKGSFKCPNGAQKKNVSKPLARPALSAPASDPVEAVMANLRQRGMARPKTVKTMISTIRAFRKGITEEQLAALLEELQTVGFISTDGSKVTYAK
jgi:HNH endonuclease